MILGTGAMLGHIDQDFEVASVYIICWLSKIDKIVLKLSNRATFTQTACTALSM